MIEKIKEHKFITIALVVLIVGVVWVVLAGGGSSSSDSALLRSSSIPASRSGNATVGGVDKELRDTLGLVRSIELNSPVLSDPAFLSLQDIGQQIVPEPFGRDNPFAPIQ